MSLEKVEARQVDTSTAFVGLGSNVGDRLAHLRYAVARMQEHEAVHVRAVSGVYETEAHTPNDVFGIRPYLNAVVKIETSLAPRALLAFCLNVERDRGRDRTLEARWMPRTLDIDLLIFDDIRVDEPDLTLPHPRMAERRFVLRPLADVGPGVDVPAPVGATVRDLLHACRDAGVVRRTAHSILEKDGPRRDE